MLPVTSAIALTRMQFGFTINFHVIFSALPMELASYLAVLNSLHLANHHPVHLDVFNL